MGNCSIDHDTGAAAERAAEHWLTRQGLHTIARNFRCRGGEIDLVMRDNDALVFVEVRLRSHRGFGGAAESVTARKQRRVVLAARHFVARHPQWRERPCRFDVLATTDATGNRWQWLRNAFDASE